jgi:hypothetical protein
MPNALPQDPGKRHENYDQSHDTNDKVTGTWPICAPMEDGTGLAGLFRTDGCAGQGIYTGLHGFAGSSSVGVGEGVKQPYRCNFLHQAAPAIVGICWFTLP